MRMNLCGIENIYTRTRRRHPFSTGLASSNPQELLVQRCPCTPPTVRVFCVDRGGAHLRECAPSSFRAEPSTRYPIPPNPSIVHVSCTQRTQPRAGEHRTGASLLSDEGLCYAKNGSARENTRIFTAGSTVAVGKQRFSGYSQRTPMPRERQRNSHSSHGESWV